MFSFNLGISYRENDCLETSRIDVVAKETKSSLLVDPWNEFQLASVGNLLAQGKILDSAIRLPALPSFYPKLNLDPKKENLATKANHNASVSKGAKYIIFVFNQWYQNTSVHMIYIYYIYMKFCEVPLSNMFLQVSGFFEKSASLQLKTKEQRQTVSRWYGCIPPDWYQQHDAGPKPT